MLYVYSDLGCGGFTMNNIAAAPSAAMPKMINNGPHVAPGNAGKINIVKTACNTPATPYAENMIP